ncbi:MFS transporter [bacterium]|nr:MAG: MFS transporter [bacterium]
MTRALRSPNYRIFFCGQIVSLVGNWMSSVALSWLVYRLTNSTLLLGTVAFAGQIPAFLLGPFAGVWVDRLNRLRVLKWTQTAAMAQSFALAFLTLTHQITVPHILLLSAFQGLINSFDMPARQSFVVQMVEDRADLPNAIALNSSMVNAARLLGPAVAGAIIAVAGEGICFFLDGFSYLAVLASLYFMRVREQPAPKNLASPLASLVEGWQYVSRFTPVRTILLLMAIVSFSSLPYTVLMPAVATDVLHGDSHALGYLMAGSGIGALCGALFLASRRSVLGLGRIIPRATATLGLGLILFSLSRNLWLSIALMPLAGFGFMVQMAACNTLLQTIVPDDKRGRAMSFFFMAFQGTLPFGSLISGALSPRIGPMETILLSGVCALCSAVWFYFMLPGFRDEVRPIYRTLGILPAEVVGVANAAAATAESGR